VYIRAKRCEDNKLERVVFFATLKPKALLKKSMERVPDVIVKREQSRSKIRLVRTDAVT
jgi:hypothetical protein